MVQKVPAKVAAKAAGKRKQAEEAAAQGFDDAERAILPGAEAQNAQRRFGQAQNQHAPPEADAPPAPHRAEEDGDDEDEDKDEAGLLGQTTSSLIP